METSDFRGLLDSNILLRLLTREPLEQALAIEDFLGAIVRSHGKLIVLPTALMEVDFVLKTQYRLRSDERRRAILDLVSSTFIDTVNRTEVLDALIIFGRSNAISFADAFHCAMARRLCDGNLVSFDRKLSVVDGITRIEPGIDPS